MRKESPHAAEVKKEDTKTAPAGMAPDGAHATRKPSDFTRDTEDEETFESSSSNAGSKQGSHTRP